MNKSDARIIFDFLVKIQKVGPVNEYDFVNLLRENNVCLKDNSSYYLEDCVYFLSDKLRFCVERFWEEVWIPFISQAREDGRMQNKKGE